jgi:hypothetical protein
MRGNLVNQNVVLVEPKHHRQLAGDGNLRRNTAVNAETWNQEENEEVQGMHNVTSKMKVGSVWSEEDEGGRNFSPERGCRRGESATVCSIEGLPKQFLTPGERGHRGAPAGALGSTRGRLNGWRHGGCCEELRWCYTEKKIKGRRREWRRLEGEEEMELGFGTSR